MTIRGQQACLIFLKRFVQLVPGVWNLRGFSAFYPLSRQVHREDRPIKVEGTVREGWPRDETAKKKKKKTKRGRQRSEKLRSVHGSHSDLGRTETLPHQPRWRCSLV